MTDTATQKKLRDINALAKRLVMETDQLIIERPKPEIKSRKEILIERRLNYLLRKK